MATTTAPLLRLRPGVHAVRRDDRHLQVGLDPPRRAILPATADVERLLTELRHGTATAGDDPVAARVLRDLAAADLLDRPEPAPETCGWVSIRSHDLDVGPLVAHLDDSGIPSRATDVDADTSMVVVAASGPVARPVLDEHVADGLTHLVVGGTGRAGTLRVGPFVEPGRTACLRCVDAHESERDPRRRLVLEQLSARPGPTVSTHDHALALAWAARDVVAWWRGRTPSTWSASVDVGSDEVPIVRAWERHPSCGCAWDELPY